METDKKKKRTNILLLLGVIILFFVVFEIVLRLFNYPNYGFQEGVFVSDDVVGYKLSPNYEGVQSVPGKMFGLKTNSKGLRDDREYNYEKRENISRILILGDSFAFGNGVELKETYAEYLRELFSNQSVEVVNLGVPGYGINNEYLSFIEEGYKYNPDIIILNYVTNDWNTHQISEDEFGNEVVNKSHTLSANDKGVLISSFKISSLVSIHHHLLFNLRTYSFFYSQSRLLLSNVVDKFLKNQGVPTYFLDKNSPEYQQAYDGYSSLIKKLDESTNAKIIILVGPSRDELLNQEQIQEAYNLNYEISPDQTQKSVEEIADKLNIQFLRVYSQDPNIFIKVDGHWTPEGHKMVAEEIYKTINKNL
ncbi:MAG: SGNH/GDSL hydrolase family protein [Candidatus Nanoarchaeia archaeon]|nr:SGNH/GDSL hydrolase family protein [Candidatus Nanoarchaeia archaeon]MDD5358475.1 SGNH/GDSL hydrolase family protein [Candidatus Nanoarchaeia archaeon]MDD5588989.1 SGNH/GDSL hydrolase family protein [Candidatus Nanoarchaeia archaeon]